MPIVRVKDNHSIRAELKYLQPQPNKRGLAVEYLYTLRNGDLIYVSPQGHEEIQALKLSAGEPFTLARLVGSGGAVTWTVERIAQPSPKPVTSARAIDAGSSVPVPPSLTTRESIRIFNQLVATIQAVKAAEEFSVSIGRPVKFGPEDIRAMGISGFIEQSRLAA